MFMWIQLNEDLMVAGSDSSDSWLQYINSFIEACFLSFQWKENHTQWSAVYIYTLSPDNIPTSSPAQFVSTHILVHKCGTMNIRQISTTVG